MNPNLRIQTFKFRQSRCQPFGSKRTQRGNREHLVIPMGSAGFDGRVYTLNAVLYRPEKTLPLSGQTELFRQPVEQCRTQIVLEPSNLLTDRALGDAQAEQAQQDEAARKEAAERKADESMNAIQEIAAAVKDSADAQRESSEMVAKAMTAEKEAVRDKDGRIVGSRVKSDA